MRSPGVKPNAGLGLARRRFRSLVVRLLPLVASDKRLLLSIGGIILLALVASFVTIREAEYRLLKSEATGAALHWARFLQSRLFALDEILSDGLVNDSDRRTLDFASAAGGLLSTRTRVGSSSPGRFGSSLMAAVKSPITRSDWLYT